MFNVYLREGRIVAVQAVRYRHEGEQYVTRAALSTGGRAKAISYHPSGPAAIFWRVRQTLKQEGRLDAAMAAYREVPGEQYTVLWPEGSAQEFRVA
jgi:hypothetical protein